MRVFGSVLGRSWVGQEAVVVEFIFKGLAMTADVTILNSLGDVLGGVFWWSCGLQGRHGRDWERLGKVGVVLWPPRASGACLGVSWVGQEAVILELLFKGFITTADITI